MNLNRRIRAISVTLCLLLGTWLLGVSCKPPAEPIHESDEVQSSVAKESDTELSNEVIQESDKIPSRENPLYAENELVGVFETEQQAQEAAELYGIELESYSYQVAVFIYEGDIMELIELGQKNGWPPLSLNRVHKAY